MKDDSFYLPHHDDFHGQHSIFVSKKGIGFGWNRQSDFESEHLRWRNALSIVGSAEYLDTSIPGLFCCVTADFVDLCMDNDYCLSFFERKDYGKETCGGCAGADWNSYGIFMMSAQGAGNTSPHETILL